MFLATSQRYACPVGRAIHPAKRNERILWFGSSRSPNDVCMSLEDSKGALPPIFRKSTFPKPSSLSAVTIRRCKRILPRSRCPPACCPVNTPNYRTQSIGSAVCSLSRRPTFDYCTSYIKRKHGGAEGPHDLPRSKTGMNSTSDVTEHEDNACITSPCV